MPHIIRLLPQLVFTSANTQAVGGLDDADHLGIFVLNTTGSATYTVQVEHTDTGINFLPLLSATTAAAGVPVVVTTNGAVTITSVAFRQIRLNATGDVSNAVCNIVKQISV